MAEDIGIDVQPEIFEPYGHQLKRGVPLFSPRHYDGWPHAASALTLGESNVLKFSVTYPLRTWQETKRPSQVLEHVMYFRLGNAMLQEIYLYDGVCILSEGATGGPSFMKAVFRPLHSYGTGGIEISQVVKAQFNQDRDEDMQNEIYYCFVEKKGISMYSENTSETHTAYLTEFQIDKIFPCKFGVLVVPITSAPNATEDSKYIYILTHPAKQVSRLWHKSPPQDLCEFDASSLILLWCEADFCVFWNKSSKDRLLIKRLLNLDKADIACTSTLSASTYYSSSDNFSSFTPAGGSLMYSPLGKTFAKMKYNREFHSVSAHYWPTFEFSSSACSANVLSSGFYPPHFCVYDDPELYFSNLFEVSLSNLGSCVEPRKCRITVHSKNNNTFGLWCLIKSNLYLYSYNLLTGEKLSHYCVKNVRDFSCSEVIGGVHTLTIVTEENTLKLGFLDDCFSIALSLQLRFNDNYEIQHINLFSSTSIIYDLKSSSKKAVLSFECLTSPVLISVASMLQNNVPEKLIATMFGNYLLLNNYAKPSGQEIVDVSLALLNSLENNFESEKPYYLRKILNLLQTFKEPTNASFFAVSPSSIARLISQLSSMDCATQSPPQLSADHSPSNLTKWLLESPRSCQQLGQLSLSSIPNVYQMLVYNPDNLSSLKNFSELKSKDIIFSPIIELFIADIFKRNQHRVRFDWPPGVIKVTGRLDYAMLPNTSNQASNVFRCSPFADREEGESEWTYHVLAMRIFSADRRLEEVCRLLDSATPILLDIEQRAEMSDHEFLEEQEKYLTQMMQVTLSAPVGRGAFTLRTETKSFVNLTSSIHIPKLCLTGKCGSKGTSIELNDLELNTICWPSFHNAVASCVAVKFSDQPADAWFAFNKTRTPEGPEQAGMILGFGLGGILTSMPHTLRHDYLSKENSFTSMAMLLGLSANLAGSGDISVWKVISLHIGAMLPGCTTELELPRLASLVAPCALGILFMQTHNNHVAKVLLGEISKRYNAVNIFGSGNNTSSNVNTTDFSGAIADRESNSLCAGFGLGFVNLSKCRLQKEAIGDDGFDGILRRFVVGGPKPHVSSEDDEDMYNQFGNSVPSVWEEYRCCHIEEGDNVNVDVTTPSAIVAVALTYLRSGNEAVLKWLATPPTLHLIDGVRPDILMLRSLASILVCANLQDISVEWLESTFMPDSLLASALKTPLATSCDYESINQAWASIVCGYCVGLGIRFAGTSDDDVIEVLWHYTNVFLDLSSHDSPGTETLGKHFLDSSICSLMISLALVMAGSGDVALLRLCRYMQNKISGSQSSSSSGTYGLEMSISMSIGILFLGGGRYSLSNDDKSVAFLFASVFPKWPINANDNRYHLQSLRHLYILAAEPRLLFPKTIPCKSFNFTIEYTNGRTITAASPVLLPPFHVLKKIFLNDDDYLPIELNFPRDLPYVKKIVAGDGGFELVPKAVSSVQYNFLKYMEWRQKKKFHYTFSESSVLSANEAQDIRELNLLSRITESSGLREFLAEIAYFMNTATLRSDWQLELKLLAWWFGVKKTSKPGEPSSCLPIELVGMCLNKLANEKTLFYQ